MGQENCNIAILLTSQALNNLMRLGCDRFVKGCLFNEKAEIETEQTGVQLISRPQAP